MKHSKNFTTITIILLSLIVFANYSCNKNKDVIKVPAPAISADFRDQLIGSYYGEFSSSTFYTTPPTNSTYAGTANVTKAGNDSIIFQGMKYKLNQITLSGEYSYASNDYGSIHFYPSKDSVYQSWVFGGGLGSGDGYFKGKKK